VQPRVALSQFWVVSGLGLCGSRRLPQPVWFCVLLGCQYEVLQLFLVSTAGEENPAHVARLSLFLARSRAVHTDSIFVQPRVALSQF
jgi:hypothetical protein